MVCLLFSLLLIGSQHMKVFEEVSELFILVPALLGLKGNLEMTLASRLSTQVGGCKPQGYWVFFLKYTAGLLFSSHVMVFVFVYCCVWSK